MSTDAPMRRLDIVKLEVLARREKFNGRARSREAHVRSAIL
jgi:hypothetical protein